MAGARLDATRSAINETIESTGGAYRVWRLTWPEIDHCRLILATLALRQPRKLMNLGGEVVGNHVFRGATIPLTNWRYCFIDSIDPPSWPPLFSHGRRRSCAIPSVQKCCLRRAATDSGTGPEGYDGQSRERIDRLSADAPDKLRHQVDAWVLLRV